MSIASILQEFQKNLVDKRDSEEDKLRQVLSMMNLSQQCLCNLRDYISKNNFSSSQHEIHFFKIQKQIPQTELVFQASLKHFMFNIPQCDKESQLSFCDKELKKLNLYFSKHNEFENYMRLGRKDLDFYYFIRPSEVVGFEYSEPFFRDPIFSSSRDLCLSRLTAYKRFADFIIDYKSKLTQTSNNKGLKKSCPSNLEWTGSKAAITELIYALHSNRIINNGTVEIKEIARAFSSMFNYEVGDIYKTYSEIKARKMSRTKFLDDLSVSLLSQINNSES